MMPMSETGVGVGVEALFPVAYFDGDRTIDMGRVPINAAMNFKGFQSVISKKIGVSPHQITIYFERPSSILPFSATSSRRFPVTNRFNFSAAINEKDQAYFFVVSKKSRRFRCKQQRPPPPQQHQSFEFDNAVVRTPMETNYYPENLVLLRRNQEFGGYTNGGLNPSRGFLNPNHGFSNLGDQSFPSKIPYLNQGGGGYSDRVNFRNPDFYPPILPTPADNLYTKSHYTTHSHKTRTAPPAVDRDRERYLLSLKLNSNLYSDLNVLPRFNRYLAGGGGSSEMTSDDGASTSGGVSSSGTSNTSCDVCAAAKREIGGVTPFHCCKLDVVLPGVFRSPAGPIARRESSSSLKVSGCGVNWQEDSGIFGEPTTTTLWDEKEGGVGGN